MTGTDTTPEQGAASEQALAEASAPPPAPSAKPKRLRWGRFLLWLLSLPLLLILLALAVLGVAIATETGLNGVLALAQRLLPGQLSYARAEGQLLGPLRIEQFRYEDGPLQVVLAQGEFDWQPRALLDGHLTITRLQVEGLDLQLPPGEESPPSAEPFTLPDIQLPLAIQIDDVQGENLRIQPAGAEPIVIDAVRLRARADAEGLRIETFEARSPLGDAQLNGQLNPVGNYPLQLQLSWRLPTPDYGEFHGQGEIRGALREQLELTQQIKGAAQLELTAAVRDLFAEPAWSAQAKLQAADLKPLVAELAGHPLNAQIKAQGVMARFSGEGELTTTLPELGATNLRFVAAGDEQGVKLDSLKLTTPQRPLALDAKGEVQFQELRFKIAGQWRSLVWPLTGPPQVESAQGELTAEGTPTDYRFQLTAEAQGPEIPKGRWTLSGQGSDQAVRGVEFKGQTLEGVLQGKADVAWLPAVSWQAALSGQGLNPGAQWKEIPGKLNLRLKSEGRLENQQLRANVLLEELTGTLSGQALRGNADIAVQNQDLTIRTLRLNAGANRVEASGALAQRWDLRWTLDAPQLQTLVPGVSGAINSSGTLSGSRDRPQVAANFTVRNLRQGETQIQQLTGEARVDVGGTARSQLKMTGQGLTLGGQRWKSVNLDGAGTPAAHDLKAELTGELGKFALALAGQLRLPELSWQGRITQLSARDTLAGNWALAQPAALQASAQQARLDNACLASAPTRLCVQGQWSAAQGVNGRAQLTDLTPERFKSFLPKGAELATRVNAEATASSKPGGAMQAQLKLNLAPGTLKMAAEGQTLRFTLKGGSLQVNSDGRTATGQAQLDLAQTGNLQATVRAQDPFGAARLDGKINALVTDLSIVSLFAPQAQNVSGQLRADVNVSGDLAKLALRGAIRLENAGVAIPQAGIRLQDVQISASSNGQGPLQLTGSARSKPGQMQVTGEIDPLKPRVLVQIKGQDFQAMDTADLRIQISPDLNIRFEQQQLHVDGQVTIPRAFLRPAGSRPGAIRPSSDVVIVNNAQGQTPPPQPSRLALFARVRVILGDEVLLETPVFKGRLKGNLLVEESPQLAPRGSGAVEVVAGNYTIFGQDVEIQRGQVLFSNSPLDNPGLDLRVARPLTGGDFGNDAIVGAQVRGTLRQPQLTLFSQPKMPDSEILSHLVLGRASQGGGSEAALLFKAANALGFGSNAITGSLGSALGLDTLQFNPDASGNGSALSLGKNLSPNLYVGYGVGLLDNANTFTMRYRLTRRLTFESNASATGTGADLTYSFER